MSSEDTKLTIVQVITRMDTVGGAQIHVRDIAKHLHLHGHTIHLVTGKLENVHQGLETIPIHYVRHLVRELRPLTDMKAFIEMRGLFKKINPDLIATHSSKAGIIGRFAAASLRIPVVFTAHGWSFTDGVPNPKKIVYRWVEKIASYFTSGIIAVSEYDRDLAIKRKVVPKGKIICIQNGVHDVRIPQRIHGEAHEARLIMIARFAHPKMQLQLLESLVKLKHLGWKIHFVGDGPEKGKVEQFAIENGITHKVFFEGWLQNVDGILAKADIFILLSEYEGLPLSILEAMRAGLPIIATDVGGVKEAVTAENGILVRVDDSSALTEVLERLIENRELQKKMGVYGRRVYEEKFTFPQMMEETLAYYRTLVRKDD
ncbi:glycosyltransferase family 4 protein [Sporosarcina luteola]|uniref:glycosyltransferase family 4 protein n=1 Tax=Sporosarcina luteola TaxID=582850 RepID=UPI00203EA02C|nr:glycosyltransferase family 4 protein [Sporosarcina luteola]MCM3711642.1 glycosyltransferase family 4 protein [Sporosarcina luteola]